jgi:hypothetical protein
MLYAALTIGGILLLGVILAALDDLLYAAPKLRERRRWVHTRWYNRR